MKIVSIFLDVRRSPILPQEENRFDQLLLKLVSKFCLISMSMYCQKHVCNLTKIHRILFLLLLLLMPFHMSICKIQQEYPHENQELYPQFQDLKFLR